MTGAEPLCTTIEITRGQPRGFQGSFLLTEFNTCTGYTRDTWADFWQYNHRGRVFRCRSKSTQQEDLNIEIELLSVSPSVEVSSIRRNVSLVFRKKIKWYPAQLDTPLEWVVTLRAEFEAEINKNGKLQEIKIDSVRLESGAQAMYECLRKSSTSPSCFALSPLNSPVC